MKITIDTNIDSANDMKDVILLLQNVLKNRGYSAEKTMNNGFNENTSSEDRLARKLAKIKTKQAINQTEPVVAPMGMFETNEPAVNPAPESEPAFNMFDSVPTTNPSTNDMLNDSNFSDKSDGVEPEVEIIPY